MINHRQKVMEDLDALLADLQSTTAHISSFQQQVDRDQQQPPQVNQRPNNNVAAVGSSLHSSPRNSTPSPLLPHPSGEQVAGRPNLKQHLLQENSSHHQQQHSYSSERVSSSSSSATYHQERSSSSSTHSQSSQQGLSSPIHYSNKPINTNANQMSSTVNSNLSELDQLLQDLNSAQFIDQVNRRNASSNQNQMVNGNNQRVVSAPVPPSPTTTTIPPGQPPVGPKPTMNSNRNQMDALLHELENTVPSSMGVSERAFPKVSVCLPPLTKLPGEPVTPPFPVPPMGFGEMVFPAPGESTYDCPADFKASDNSTSVRTMSESNRGDIGPNPQMLLMRAPSPVPVIVVSEPVPSPEEPALMLPVSEDPKQGSDGPHHGRCEENPEGDSSERESQFENETEQCPPRPPLPKLHSLRQLSHSGRHRRSSSRESPGSRRRRSGSSSPIRGDKRTSEMVFNTRVAAVVDAESISTLKSTTTYFSDCDAAGMNTSGSVYPFESRINVRSLSSQSSVPLEIECLRVGKIIVPLLDEESFDLRAQQSINSNSVLFDSASLSPEGSEIESEGVLPSRIEDCREADEGVIKTDNIEIGLFHSAPLPVETSGFEVDGVVPSRIEDCGEADAGVEAVSQMDNIEIGLFDSASVRGETSGFKTEGVVTSQIEDRTAAGEGLEAEVVAQIDNIGISLFDSNPLPMETSGFKTEGVVPSQIEDLREADEGVEAEPVAQGDSVENGFCGVDKGAVSISVSANSLKSGSRVFKTSFQAKGLTIETPFEDEVPEDDGLVFSGWDSTSTKSGSVSPDISKYEEEWLAVLYKAKAETATFPEEFLVPEDDTIFGLEASSRTLNSLEAFEVEEESPEPVEVSKSVEASSALLYETEAETARFPEVFLSEEGSIIGLETSVRTLNDLGVFVVEEEEEDEPQNLVEVSKRPEGSSGFAPDSRGEDPTFPEEFLHPEEGSRIGLETSVITLRDPEAFEVEEEERGPPGPRVEKGDGSVEPIIEFPESDEEEEEEMETSTHGTVEAGKPEGLQEIGATIFMPSSNEEAEIPLVEFPPDLAEILELSFKKEAEIPLVECPPDLTEILELSSKKEAEIPLVECPPDLAEILELSSKKEAEIPLVECPPDLAEILELSSKKEAEIPLVECPPDLAEILELSSKKEAEVEPIIESPPVLTAKILPLSPKEAKRQPVIECPPDLADILELSSKTEADIQPIIKCPPDLAVVPFSKEELAREPSKGVLLETALEVSATSKMIDIKEVVEIKSSKERGIVVPVHHKTSRDDGCCETEAQSEEGTIVPILVKTPTKNKYPLVPAGTEGVTAVPIPIKVKSLQGEGLGVPIGVGASREESPVEIDIPIAQEIRVTVATRKQTSKGVSGTRSQNAIVALPSKRISRGSQDPPEIIGTPPGCMSAVTFSSSSSSSSSYTSVMANSLGSEVKAPVPTRGGAERPSVLPIQRPIFVDISSSHSMSAFARNATKVTYRPSPPLPHSPLVSDISRLMSRSEGGGGGGTTQPSCSGTIDIYAAAMIEEQRINEEVTAVPPQFFNRALLPIFKGS